MSVPGDLGSALSLLAAHINDVRAALVEIGQPAANAPTAILGDLIRATQAISPENLAPPVISGHRAGATLTVSTGAWRGTSPITFIYAWLRNGTPISGAATSSLATAIGDAGDSIVARVTASNAHGTASVDSAPVVLAGDGVTDVLMSSTTLMMSSSALISTLYR